jgi:hypothetical protein
MKGVCMASYSTTKVSDGFGFGGGTISAAQIRQTVGDQPFTDAEHVIGSTDILVALDVNEDGQQLDDDGCGDGRAVGRVFQGTNLKSTSLNRAKVFGGGAAMTAATIIGLGNTDGQLLVQIFLTAIANLQDKHIDFGAHTADHVTGPEDSGCGAIDKAPAILQAALTYETQIRATIAALGFETKDLDEIFKNFSAVVDQLGGQIYHGADVVSAVQASGKVVKELTGQHVEGFVVLNTIQGYTVNQKSVRSATVGKVDVFAVDVWRLQSYANRLYETADEQARAFISELVYTLATAAVLTSGDLPVYLVA